MERVEGVGLAGPWKAMAFWLTRKGEGQLAKDRVDTITLLASKLLKLIPQEGNISEHSRNQEEKSIFPISLQLERK